MEGVALPECVWFVDRSALRIQEHSRKTSKFRTDVSLVGIEHMAPVITIIIPALKGRVKTPQIPRQKSPQCPVMIFS